MLIFTYMTEPKLDRKITFVPPPEIDVWREKLENMSQSELNEAKLTASINLYEVIKAQTEIISTSRHSVGSQKTRRIIAPKGGNEGIVIEATNVSHAHAGSRFRDHRFRIGIVAVSSKETGENEMSPAQEIKGRDKLRGDFSLRDMQAFVDEILLMRELERQLERQLMSMGDTGEQAQASKITE
jgi:hypothetical protein